MKVNNALVTWDDLATMGLTAKNTAPTGLGIANKAEIINSYYVDENASPFSTYTSDRCPPYQTIVPLSPIGKAIGAGGFDSGIFGIYTSINYGLNWSLLKQINPFSPVAIDTLTFNVAASLTFQYITYFHCYQNLNNELYYFDLYKSSDYGTTWTKITTPSIDSAGTDIAISDDGLYQILTTSTTVYTSLNYGVTWSQVSGLAIGNYVSVAISSNGQYQTFIKDANLIYASSNYGASFNIISIPITLKSTAMSKDGKYQYAIGLELFQSTNYGASFAKISSTQDWDQCAVSQTGQYVLLSRTAGYGLVNDIVKSSNFGVSYSYLPIIPVDTYIVTLAVSPDGQYQLLGGQDISGGYPYTNNVILRSSDYGASFPQVANTNIGWNSLGMGQPYYTTTTTTTTTAPTTVSLTWGVGNQSGGNLKVLSNTGATLLNITSTAGSSQNGILTILSSQLPYTIRGSWVSGISNIVKYRVCDGTGEIFYSGSITNAIGSVDYTPSPTPENAIVYLTSNDVTPAFCPE